VRIFDLFAVKLLCKFMPFAASSSSSTFAVTSTALAFVGDCLLCGGSNGQIAAVRLFPGTSKEGGRGGSTTVQPVISLSSDCGHNRPPVSSLYAIEEPEKRWVVTMHAGPQGCALLWALDVNQINPFDSSDPGSMRESPIEVACILDLPGLLAGCRWHNLANDEEHPSSTNVFSVLVALRAVDAKEEDHGGIVADESHLSVVNLTTSLPLPNLTCTVPGLVTRLSVCPPSSSSSSLSSPLSTLSLLPTAPSSETSHSCFAVGTTTGAVLLLNGHLQVMFYGDGGHSGPVKSLALGSKSIASASNGEVLVWKLPKTKQ